MALMKKSRKQNWNGPIIRKHTLNFFLQFLISEPHISGTPGCELLLQIVWEEVESKFGRQNPQRSTNPFPLAKKFPADIIH